MNRKINCVIVDDDPYAIDIIKDYIAAVPALELKKTYTNSVDAAIEISRGEKVDLLFLDVDMPKITGLQLAAQLRDQAPNIIFTTAFQKYAMDGYEHRIKHFLLKPISLPQFSKVVTSVIPLLEPRSQPGMVPKPFFARTGVRGKVIRILRHEIVYISGAINYVDLHTMEERYTVYMTLKEMEEELMDDQMFYRVHRSTIINAAYVNAVNGNMVTLGQHTVDMSNQYKSKFIQYVNEHTLLSKRLT